MKKSKVWYRKISEAISLLFKKKEEEKGSKRGLLMVLPFIVITVVLVFIFFISNKNTDETSNSTTWPWLIGIIILAIIIADLRKPSSYIRTLFAGDYTKYKKHAIKVLGSIICITIAGYFILRWWNNRPTSPDTPIQYVSHSVTTGTLQTQHVSTATGTGPEDITLGEKYMWQPGAVYVWRKEPVQKYFLPVQCNTSITVFVHTDDRSSHYMYQACRDADGKASYREYDHTGTMPDGYVKAKLIGDAEVEMKYTAYLK